MKAIDRSFSTAMRGAGVLVAVALSALASRAQGPATSPARPMVADVVVRGNAVVPTQQIQAQLKTRPGRPYAPETAEEDVRTLYATKQFGNVQTYLKPEDDGKVTVYFLVVEYPSKIEKVVYMGSKHLSDEDLGNLTGVKVGTILNPMANKAACLAIVRRLNDDGRAFATCDLLKGGTPGDKEVVFNITEGPITVVRDIRFAGNHFVGDGRLATQINTSKQFLHVIGGKYNPAMAENDVHKLEEYFRDFGYLDVRVALDRYRSADGKEVVLTYHIQEGPRYHLGADPKVNKTRYLPEEQLSQLVKLRAGEVYDKNKIEADLTRLKDYEGALGHETQARANLVYSKDTLGVVTVNYEVEEQPPARVGQILIVGNERTRDRVILRQLGIYPGQVLSFPEVRAAERNLGRLGIFNSQDGSILPTVTVLPSSDENSPFRDILVRVQEQNTGSLLFGLGVNSDAGLTGSIVLNERNFDILRPPTSLEDLLSGNAWRGAGQELRIEAVPGTQLQRYQVTFREPFLFDTRVSLTTSGYYYERQFNEYNEDRLGGRVGLGYKLNQNWSVNGTTRVENVGVHSVSPFAPDDYQSVVGDNFLVGLRLGVTRDTRDSFLRPTSGSILDLSYEECLGDHVFPLINIDFNKYFTVYQRPDGSGRHVLALHSAVGWAGDNTPVYERFFAGGFRSLRGFAFRGVGPDVNGFKTGGDFMLLNSLEYQIPIKANDQLYMVGFIDSGTVESRIDTIHDYRVSVGFGVRVVVPMLGPMPIALDFGFPVVKGPGDQEQIFNFFVGFTR